MPISSLSLEPHIVVEYSLFYPPIVCIFMWRPCSECGFGPSNVAWVVQRWFHNSFGLWGNPN
jgi:hypothetical protein